MIEYLTIFATGYAAVFLQGFQSRNVNNGDYGWAAVSSVGIAMSQVFLWKTIVTPETGLLQALTYGLAGATAIVSAMFIHRKYINKKPRRE